MTEQWNKREQVMPLPTKAESFVNLVLLGTTGSGKTTLLRQLIGTNPETERFPSTSTSKTTTADFEVICDFSANEYSAVVSFQNLELTKEYIEQSIIQAIYASNRMSKPSDIARKLLEHSEQRFRLKYLIGDYLIPDDEDDDEEQITNDMFESENQQDSSLPSKQQIQLTLNKYLADIKSISVQSFKQIFDELGINDNYDALSNDDKMTIDELFSVEVIKNELFQNLKNEIIEQVKSKFDLVKLGAFEKVDEWYDTWTFSTKDRALFIKTVNQFTSNNAKMFGALLTPLVEGIRVKGPFQPNGFNEPIKLVIIDGEGIGHNPNESGLSKNLMKKLRICDHIILVDNAVQSMQGNTGKMLNYIISSGYIDNMSIAFTHLDRFNGDNFSNNADKKERLKNDCDNLVRSFEMEQFRHTSFTNQFHRIFFFGNLQQKGDSNQVNLNKQLTKFIEMLKPKAPENISQIKLVYDRIKLQTFIRKTMLEYNERWNSRLFTGQHLHYYRVHWGSIKAFTRRLAENWWQREYYNLKPEAELNEILIQELNKFLYQYEREKLYPYNSPDIFISKIINNTIKDFGESTLNHIESDIFQSKIYDWQESYQFSGRGSSFLRANKVKSILHQDAYHFDNSELLCHKFMVEMEKCLNANNCELIN